MATQYTSLLGLALPVTGELQGTWGDTVNNAITALLDTAVAGTTTLSTDGDVTLTTTTGASNQARQAVLLCTGARTAQRTIVAPAQSKTYTVINATTGGFSIKVVGVGPTTGVTIAAGESALIAWNGSDFIKISNTGGAGTFTNLTVTGNLTVNSLTNTRVPYASTSGLLVDSANMTFNGTRLTVADLADSGLTPTRVVYSTTGGALVDSANLTFDGTNLTLGGGTANGVAYLNGSKVLTTGSALTFDGTNLTNTQTSTSPIGLLLNNNSASTSAGTRVRFQFNGSDTGWIANQFDGVDFNNQYNASRFHIWLTGGSTEQMRLTSTGLGIGTSSPGAKLDVLGGGRFQQSNFVDNVLRLSTGASTTGNVNQILFADQLTSATAAITAYNSAYGSSKNYALGFTTNGSERMLLDSSGNLGLGVTPSAWSAAGGIDFPGGGGVGNWGLSGNATWLASNMYYATGNYRYKNSNTAASYVVGNGQHAWFTAPSGTAGAAISFTQAMTLDASGNLLVGGTSAVGSAKIQANGDVSVLAGNKLYLWNSANNSAPYLRSPAAGNIAFYSTSDVEYGRFDSSGNLGIGTTSPGVRLDIVSSSNAIGARIRARSGDDFGFLQFTNNAGSTEYAALSGSSGTLAFYTGASSSERMRLDSVGNLGLGVTPSAWDTVTAFQIKNGSLYGFGTGETAYSQNAYYGSGTFRYITSSVAATQYQQINGVHRWFTAPSGTAGNAISFTQAMTLDASGNLLVGNTSQLLFTTKELNVNAASGSAGFALATAGSARLYMTGSSTDGNITTKGAIPLLFGTNETERARIDASGNLLVNATSAIGRPGISAQFVSAAVSGRDASYFLQTTNSQFAITSHVNTTSGTRYHIGFGDGTTWTERGTISTNGTSTTYATSSDYRLKENIQPMTGALAKVAALKPCTYTWKADGSDGEGFIAHELAEVVPQAVTGEKDAVDAEGKPVYQGIDTSFLVATLTAALQEAVAEINSLKARLDAANL